MYDLDDVYDMFETLEVGVQGLNASNITYDLPNAENYYKTAMSIPIFPSMTEKDQDTVVSVLRKAFKSWELL